MKIKTLSTPSGNIYLTETETGKVAADKKTNLKANKVFDAFKNEVINSYYEKVKTPMLIVGANNWLRQNVPFETLQKFDLHLLFYPNSNAIWVCGIIAINRITLDTKSVFSYGADQKIETALKKSIWELVAKTDETEAEKLNNAHETLWVNLWVYRCAKLSLKDVLHLEEYQEKLDNKIEEKEYKFPKLFRVVKGGKS